MAWSKLRTRRPAVLAAGLLSALVLSHAFAVDWSTAQAVTVVTIEYAFVPSKFDFHHGVAYRLHLENHGKELHEFGAANFFRAIELGNPEVLNADHTEIDVPPGEQKDLLFVAGAPGQYKLKCPDHDWAGMVGEITIEP